MSKRIGLALAAAFFLIGALGAQVIDLPQVAVETGVDLGYNLDTSNIGTGYRATILVGVSDRVQAGFHYISGDAANLANYQLFGLDYAVAPRLGASIYLGKQTSLLPAPSTIPINTATVGMGINAVLFSRSVQGGLETALRLRVDYLVPVTANNMGIGLLRFGLASSIGL